MQIFAGGSTMGGSQAGFDTALAETHPINDPQEVEEAIAYANEALEAASRLSEMALDYQKADPTATGLLNVAVEQYIERFKIPMAAMESQDDYNDDGTPKVKTKPQASNLKKVILWLYAMVERIFTHIFDLLTTHKADARKILPLTKVYIGHADSLTSGFATQLNLRDRSLMISLHIDGIPPKRPSDLFQKLAGEFERQYSASPVAECVRLVTAAKAKDTKRVQEEAVLLREKLERGLRLSLEEVDPARIPVFVRESKNPSMDFFASEPMFGQNYIVGVVGKDVRPDSTFTYHCAVRRDSDVPLRTPGFPCLSPEEIRLVCRTASRLCENIIRFSRDEDLMKKVLRDATFLTTSTPDKSSVVALRNMTAVGQNSYIVYLRYVTNVMQAMMRWCAMSIRRHEEQQQ